MSENRTKTIPITCPEMVKAGYTSIRVVGPDPVGLKTSPLNPAKIRSTQPYDVKKVSNK